jgi:hypothetical protein
VVVVEPGLVDTGFAARATADMGRFGQPGEPYAEAFARAQTVMAQAEAASVGPARIARVITRIARKRRPGARYVAPWSSSLLLALVAVLPTSWLDAILRRAVHLRRPAAAALTEAMPPA